MILNTLPSITNYSSIEPFHWLLQSLTYTFGLPIGVFHCTIVRVMPLRCTVQEVKAPAQVVIDEAVQDVRVWRDGESGLTAGTTNLKCSANRTADEIIPKLQELADSESKTYITNIRLRDACCFAPFFLSQIHGLSFEGQALGGSSTLESYGIKDGSHISMMTTVSSGEGWCCCMGYTVPADSWIKGGGGAMRVASNKLG